MYHKGHEAPSQSPQALPHVLSDDDSCVGMPCRNGGRCQDGMNGYRCEGCFNGYSGTNCERGTCLAESHNATVHNMACLDTYQLAAVDNGVWFLSLVIRLLNFG